jgi:large subunit ribosomal protein L15
MDLPKVKTRSKKRLGRGYGSGKGGHTSSRGQKGQKSRGGVNILFEGYKVRKSLLNRLPFQRGKGKFKASAKPMVINVEALNLLKDGGKVDIETLAKAGIVKLGDAKSHGVKILGNGKLTRKLTVFLPASASAVKKIEKAGGSVEAK